MNWEKLILRPLYKEYLLGLNDQLKELGQRRKKSRSYAFGLNLKL